LTIPKLRNRIATRKNYFKIYPEELRGLEALSGLKK